MKPGSVSLLFVKIVCAIGPFMVWFAFITIHIPYITSAQQSLAEDRIQQLIIRASTSPQVIIDGDSRAEDNVIPQVFTQITGLSAVNVASGDILLQQAYDTLSAKKVLNQKRVIVISVSIYDIEDSQGHNQFFDKIIIDSEPWGKQKARDLFHYYKAIAIYYFNYATSLMRFAKFDYSHMAPSLLQTKGYLADTKDVLTTPRDGSTPDPDPLGWYRDLKLGGLRQNQFVQAIQKFGALNDTVVLYIGPKAPLGKEAEAGTNIPAADAYFAKVIADSTAPYPNLHFLNFKSMDTSAILPNEDFGDFVHLNDTGAKGFTKLLADTLEKDGVIK